MAPQTLQHGALPAQARAGPVCARSLPPRVRRAAVRAAARAQQRQDEAGDAAGWPRRAAGSLLAALAALQLTAAPPAIAKEPFLSSTGAKGLLAEEEERLFRLRQEIESEAQAELSAVRAELEASSRETQAGKLCATPFGVDVVGITEFVALTGALVGGFSARQRKEEVERLNEQLRKINLSLRQQARSGTIYAPGLTYAPSPTFQRVNGGVSVLDPPQPPQPPAEAPEDAAAGPQLATSSVMPSMDEEDMCAEEQQCLMALREGKRLLKERQGPSAMVRFEKALMLAKSLGEKIYERRATRGLAATARLQGQTQRAIELMKRVLEISEEVGDHRGDADVHGTIADMLTSQGDFSQAATYYDKYIAAMSSDAQ